jgi:hypothetical protein
MCRVAFVYLGKWKNFTTNYHLPGCRKGRQSLSTCQSCQSCQSARFEDVSFLLFEGPVSKSCSLSVENIDRLIDFVLKNIKQEKVIVM